ncbi:MAG TPA: YtxH domain-containing protein [Ktedonobacteraceae bacterium]|jgi:gas vesicle protein|nr:YtxH domain-containing protein [Ktedonobacteraceae bacterium]
MMKFYFGLLVGLGVGVVIGLLVAPQSGEATRAQLSEQGISLGGGSFSDEIRARANDALVQGRELYSRTKGELSSQYSRAKSGEL